MSLTVLLAPASSGKTHWVLSRAREMAVDLQSMPRLIVPSQIQAFDCKKRLGELGGGLGLIICTFEELSWQILELAGRYPTKITENIQRHLLKDLLLHLDLKYYSGIREMPGFISSLLDIFRELKAGDITSDLFLSSVEKSDPELRLLELAEIYQAYQDLLERLELVDPVGVVKLAGDELLKKPDICQDWNGLFFDGFDDLSPVQLRLAVVLSKIVQPAYLTLTGGESIPRAALIHSRFQKLLKDLSQVAGAEIKTLDLDSVPGQVDLPVSKLRKLIFNQKGRALIDPGDRIGLSAVPDREAEVRTALRWLANLQRVKSIPFSSCAVLMRSQEPYRAILERVAREYRLPIRIQGGLPLKENPLIAAIQSLLKAAAAGKTGLAWQEVVELWRSPYFSWDQLYISQGLEYTPEKHYQSWVRLTSIAHWGSVIASYEQWQEVFELLLKERTAGEDAGTRGGLKKLGLTSLEVEELWDLFNSFCKTIFAPVETKPVEDHIYWLEGLLGVTEADETSESPGLNLIQNILIGPPDLTERDWKAFLELYRILREQIWVSRILGGNQVDFDGFYSGLAAVIDQSKYQPLELDHSSITCADITEVRGLCYEAVAILGLAEGEFPGTVKEDPFLRDLDRIALKTGSGIPLQLSTESAEAEYFYESISRTSSNLLITRPRIADNGAPWQASPYWEEVVRCVDLVPEMETTASKAPLNEAGSLAEYLEIFAGKFELLRPEWSLPAKNFPEIVKYINQASEIIKFRFSNLEETPSQFEGGLGDFKESFSARFPASHVWSSSRLETYRSCPFSFFVSSVLQLEKPEPPAEGLDSRQLGNVYHHILEKLYQAVGDRYTLEDLLDRLPEVAREILDEAPAREGFRATAWWDQTRNEILENLRRTLIVLENIDPDFRFFRAEQKFGIRNDREPNLFISLSEGRSYQLRGLIDRVDINQAGEIRIIDYKTSGPYGFTNQAIRDGKKLQLPLYALAAQDALGLGQVKEGFYFHVRSAQPSSLKLSNFRESGNSGPAAAIARAAERGWEAVQSIQAGQFPPQPPDSGCPDYCPAAGFCWRYQASSW